jgi:hypothetical protein
MNSRRPTAWYLGLLALIVIPAAIALLQIWVASGDQLRVDAFYASRDDGQFTEEEYRYWDAISRNAITLVTVFAPTLFTGAAVAGFALLSVLAFRWERRRNRVRLGLR